MRTLKKPFFVLLLLLLAALACSLPGPEPSEPTPVATTTEPESPQPTATFAPPTDTPAPESDVVVFLSGQFHLYDLSAVLLESRPAPGLTTWAHPNQFQVLGDDVFYVDSGGDGLGGSVKRAAAAGLQELAFTAVPDLAKLSFAVSSDGGKIVWGSAQWGDSQLWTANIDGSGQTLVQESNPASGLEDFYVLEAYRWTDSGSALYAWQISGIGNLLYFGYSSLYEYEPDAGVTNPLAEAPTGGGMPCWSAVSEDLGTLVGTCHGESGPPGMREWQVGTGVETVLPLLPDQDQAGAAAYSPSGTKLAYAYARGGTDDVDGWVAVRMAPGEAPQSIASIADGYFHKVRWGDEERLVVEGSEGGITRTYLLPIGGALTPIAEGELIGLMHP
jgi:hypothetical protein